MLKTSFIAKRVEPAHFSAKNGTDTETISACKTEEQNNAVRNSSHYPRGRWSRGLLSNLETYIEPKQWHPYHNMGHERLLHHSVKLRL